MEGESALNWVPLETNPEVMTEFIHKLGVSDKWKLVDVLGTEPELLAMVPQPTVAVLLLVPINEKYKEYCDGLKDKPKTEEESDVKDAISKVFYMRQTVGNACGTVALIHAIANNAETVSLSEEGLLGKFIAGSKGKTPEEIGAHLEKNKEISDCHGEHAQMGQTEAPSANENVNLHFIAFVNYDGCLLELDGRKEAPIFHGKTSAEAFITDAAKVCKEFMERDPEELHFSIAALSAA